MGFTHVLPQFMIGVNRKVSGVTPDTD